jgi:hypothetical protein
MGTLTSEKPIGFYGLLQGYLYLYLYRILLGLLHTRKLLPLKIKVRELEECKLQHCLWNRMLGKGKSFYVCKIFCNVSGSCEVK